MKTAVCVLISAFLITTVVSGVRADTPVDKSKQGQPLEIPRYPGSSLWHQLELSKSDLSALKVNDNRSVETAAETDQLSPETLVKGMDSLSFATSTITSEVKRADLVEFFDRFAAHNKMHRIYWEEAGSGTITKAYAGDKDEGVYCYVCVKGDGDWWIRVFRAAGHPRVVIGRLVQSELTRLMKDIPGPVAAKELIY